jgi:hypothetical protein
MSAENSEIACANCGEIFVPGIKTIQIYCRDPDCIRERKRYYMRHYMRKWLARRRQADVIPIRGR